MFDPSDWSLIAIVAPTLGVTGFLTRARGRRGIERAAATASARRRLRDVQPGVVAVEGTWRVLDGGRGLIEDDGAAAVIDRGAGAPALADGARVLCCGVARGDAPDPRGGYRGSGRLPLIMAGGADEFVSTDLGRLDRARRDGKRHALIGALLVILSVALVVAAFAMSLQLRD